MKEQATMYKSLMFLSIQLIFFILLTTAATAGSITGTVLSQTTGTPVQGAAIHVMTRNFMTGRIAHIAASNPTGADGIYTVAGLADGSYIIRAYPPMGYGQLYYPDTQDPMLAADIAIAGSAAITGKDFSLPPGGTISGYVYRSDGTTPVRNANVHAQVYANNRGGFGYCTDENGYFSFPMAYGTYRVQADGSCDPVNQSFVREFYDNANYYLADPVTVDEVAQPNLTFSLTAGGWISGTVTDPAGNPIDDLHIDIYESGCGRHITGGETDENGHYLISGVPAGSVVVRAMGTQIGLNYVTEYFGTESHECSLAEPVPVNVGQVSSGIDFSLTPGGTVSGRVTDDTESAIAGMRINAYEYGCGEHLGETRTDANGQYTLTGLPEGGVSIQARSGEESSNYIPEYYDSESTDCSMADPVIVVMNQTTGGVDFTLSPGGTVSGRVTGTSGNPIPSISVNAYQTGCGAHITGTDTDANGQYTLTGLPTGDIHIQARGGDNGLSYTSEYFGTETNDCAQAAPVSVALGQTTTGIDFEMVSGGAVSGTVTDESGNPVMGLNVNAYATACGVHLGRSATDADGHYEIQGLPAGGITVQVSSDNTGLNYVAEYFGIESNDCRQATPITVTAGQTTVGIDFSIAPGGSVSGTVRDVSGNPIAGLNVDANLPVCGHNLAVSKTDENGHYEIHGLPAGNVNVYTSIRNTSLNYVEVYYGSTTRDCNQAAPVPVMVGQTTTDIDFYLAPAGTVVGTVTDGSGSPIAGLNVSAKLPQCGDYINGIETDANGQYTLTGLPEGEVAVNADGSHNGLNYISEWYGAESSDCRLAGPVSVTPGQITSGINFSLDPGGSISGTVTDNTENPIQGMGVNAYFTGCGNHIAHAETDATGQYTLNGLPPGDVHVRVDIHDTGLNYVQTYFGTDTADCNQAVPIAVSVGQTTGGIDFTLAPGGTVTGQVTDESGVPIADLHVWAELSGCNGGWLAGVNTDSGGNFELNGLPEGNVNVNACGRCSNLNWVSEWFGADSNQCAQATPVAVVAGGTTADIDFTLTPGATVSGTVFEDDGVTALTGTQIQVVAYTGDSCGYRQHVESATTDPATGQYEMMGVPAGTFFLQTNHMNQSNYVNEWWTGDALEPSSSACENAASVSTIAGNTYANKNFALALGGGISGVVLDEEGTPISNLWVEAWAGRCFNDQYGGSYTDGNGSYTIRGVAAGNAYVRACAACNDLGYADAWYGGSADCGTAVPVNVAVEALTADIDFTLIIDADHDGVSDVWETTHFGGIEAYDGNGDPDNDGLNNFKEIENGTAPNNPDSDGDLFADGYEIEQGTAPLNSAQFPDIPITGSVMNVHESDGSLKTYIGVQVGNGYVGQLPDSLNTVIITGPDGLNLSKGELTFFGSVRVFHATIEGSPVIGTYAFHVESVGGSTGDDTDSQNANVAIPLADTSAFVPPSGGTRLSKTPQFFWNPVAFGDTTLYYRLEIMDMSFNTVYTSGRVAGMTAHTVPEGRLAPGGQYQWRVRITDSDTWEDVENRANSGLVPFAMAGELNHAAVPAVDLDGWGVVNYTTANGTNLDVEIRFIDHDGVTDDGSSHTATLTAPDGSVHPLEWRGAEGIHAGRFGRWFDMEGEPAPAGPFTFTVTDPDGNTGTAVDDLVVNPLDPVDETTLVPSLFTEQITARVDNVEVNGQPFDNFDSYASIGDLDTGKWFNPWHPGISIAGQQLRLVNTGNVGVTPCPLNFANPSAVSSIAADVTLDAASSTVPDLRLGGNWYNNGENDVAAAITVKNNAVNYWVIELVESGGLITLNFLDTGSLKAVSIGQTVHATVSWDGTTFTFDADGTSHSFTPPAGPKETAHNNQKWIDARINLFTADTTPTFTWAAVADAVRYRVRIYDSYGSNTLWKGYTGFHETTYTVPPGVLKAGALYRYRVDAYDSHMAFEIDNVSRTPSADTYAFFTGFSQPEDPVPYVEMDSTGVQTWNTDDGGASLSFWVKVHDAQGVPDNIDSVKVRFPGGEEESLAYEYGESATSAYYSADSALPVQGGDYTFIVQDKDGHNYQYIETLANDPVGYPAEASLQPANNTTIGSTAVNFDWEDVPGAAFYRVEIYDSNLLRIHAIATTDSQLTLPEGLLEKGKSYRWRITTRREFFDENVDNASASPASKSAMFTFLTTQEFLAGDVNGDGAVSLEDAIVALRLTAGLSAMDTVNSAADVNADDAVGLEEAVYVLQAVSGLRAVFSPNESIRISIQHFYENDYYLAVVTDKPFTSVDISGPHLDGVWWPHDTHALGNLTTRPSVGEVYTVTVHYTDGSQETSTYTVSDNINDSFATIVAPANGTSIQTTQPTFSWTSASGITSYFLNVHRTTGQNDVFIWGRQFPAGTTSGTYNTDGTASEPLAPGNTYRIYIHTYNAAGNQATTSAVFSVVAGGL